MVSKFIRKGKICQVSPTISSCLSILLLANPAAAYLGPGAGLGMLGSLIAIFVVVIVIVLGLVIYPVRMLRKRRLQTPPNDTHSKTAD